VVVGDYYGQAIGEFDEQKISQIIKLRFACKALGADQTTAINNAVKLAEKIMLQFIQKMRKDFEDDSCGILRYVVLEKVKWEAFEGPWLDSFYGFDLEIPFKTYMPAYDPAQWTY
jgi:hypothetical protein